MVDAPSVSHPFLVRWRVCGGGQGEMKQKERDGGNSEERVHVCLSLREHVKINSENL